MDPEELVAIARRELAAQGLHGWTFVLARTKRRLGACKYRLQQIEVAEAYARLSPRESVLDTLRHEIAHALAGPGAGHGPAWQRIAARLGATPRACDTSTETVTLPGDWQAVCPACGRTLHLYRRPASLTGYRCRCPARAGLTFAYQGDPARAPVVPLTIEAAATWEATCGGCGRVHLRQRRPKAGVWRCKCPHRSEIVWRPRSRPG